MADEVLNRAVLQAGLARGFSETTAALSAAATVMGIELGLFDRLAVSPDGLDVASLARQSRLDRGFLQAWLISQTEAGFLRLDGDRYVLEAEQRALLQTGGANDLVGLYQVATGLCSDLPAILAAVRAGRPLEDGALSEITRAGFSRLAETRADRWLDEWIEFLPEVARALESGIGVADLGGGTGALARRLAARYPASRIVLLDPQASDPGAAGIRVERTALDRLDERFDLFLSVESFHHFSDPRTMARAVRGHLRDAGSSWVIVEPMAPEPGLLRRHLAAISALYCLPATAGSVVASEGSLIRPGTVTAILIDAGFARADVAGRTLQHCVIEARP